MTTHRPYSPSTAKTVRASADAQLVTVEVVMDHLSRYGRPVTQQLTYAAVFTVRVGQTVLCPPTRLNGTWTKGTVVGREDGQYQGPVKYIRPLGAAQRRKMAAQPTPKAQPAQQQLPIYSAEAA